MGQGGLHETSILEPTEQQHQFSAATEADVAPGLGAGDATKGDMAPGAEPGEALRQAREDARQARVELSGHVRATQEALGRVAALEQDLCLASEQVRTRNLISCSWYHWAR